MIRIICPHCGSKLNAKEELVGQTRKCPKCSQPVQITAEVPQPASPPIQVEAEERLPEPKLPERLNRESHYLICDRSRVMATWENNGAGWMYRSGAGFMSAKRTRESLPAQGNFQLVELKFAITPEGRRLAGLTTYQLISQWALNALASNDDAIVSKITGLGSLNGDQKNAVRQALKDQFMRDVWAESTVVVEYLANTDYHSSGVG
jgi:phage FluMu protein Com